MNDIGNPSLRQKINNGGFFNATVVKIIAVFFMTIDHIGAKLLDVPVIAGQAERLRMLGRIAAPLFLFLVAESARKTMNKNDILFVCWRPRKLRPF